MNSIQLDIEPDLAALLHQANRSAQNVARELMVTELYRRGVISSGKAAELLGMSRLEFIRYASQLGIAFLDMAEEEWESERKLSESL